jgi:L-aspartate oxidase
VSRAVHRVLSGGSRVWLDATAIERQQGAGTLARRFPTITATARARGVDWSREAVAVTPAAHYTMGGVVSDLDGRTSVPGVFVAGEAAATGVHGANRLASNSLLEGLVFGARAAHACAAYVAAHSRGGGRWQLHGAAAAHLVERAEMFARYERPHSPVPKGAAPDAELSDTAHEKALRAAIDLHLAIERDADGLREVLRLARAQHSEVAELADMAAQSAAARNESRGAHYRTDAPHADQTQQTRRAWISHAVSPTDLLSSPHSHRAVSSHRSDSFRSVSAC